MARIPIRRPQRPKQAVNPAKAPIPVPWHALMVDEVIKKVPPADLISRDVVIDLLLELRQAFR